MVNLMVCSYKNGKFMTGNGKLLWLIYGQSMDNLWLMVNSYPLVNFQSLQTGTWPSRNSGFSQQENGGSFHSSIVMLVYQRIYSHQIPVIHH